MTRRGWVILGGFGLVALLIGAGVLHHVRLKRAVEQYRRELIAKGNKLTVQELAPTNDQAALDAGAEFLRAASRVSGIGAWSPGIMRLVAPGRAQVASQQEQLLDEHGTNLWPKLTATLDEQQAALADTCDVIEHNRFQFPVDYSSGLKMRFPPLATLKNVTQTLCAAAILELHRGNTTQACKYIHAGARLNQIWETEPLRISDMVKMAMQAIVWAATWEALHYPHWTEAQLAELQNVWAQTEFIEGLDTVLGMERVSGRMTFEELRRSQSNWIGFWSEGGIFGVGSGGGDGVLDEALAEARAAAKKLAHQHVGYWRWRWWVSYIDELSCNHVWQEGIRAQKGLLAARSYEDIQLSLTKDLAALRKTHRSPVLLLGTRNEMLKRFFRRAVTAQVQREMMVAGIALHRHRLRHGGWPTNLVQLVPEFLPELPRDYMDGQPLRYRLRENGKFLLYSVGQDFEDNGGNPEFTGEARYLWAGRDWVWPEPASAEEISTYWRKRAKKR